MDQIWVPESFEPYMEQIGEAIYHPAVAKSSAYRKWLTRTEPLLFGLVYFPHLLQSRETNSLVSLCQFHIDTAFSAARWVKQQVAPMEIRDVWIGPREMGKTIWKFLVEPAWALAHQHIEYMIAFADSSDVAEGHLANLVREFRENEYLQLDYPYLCLSVVNNVKKYVSKGGRISKDEYFNPITIEAVGIDSSTLGKRAGKQRPQLLLFDDVEPKGTKYSARQMIERLDNIRNFCFPMNVNAIVQISGTTVAYNSIIHQCVLSVTGGKVAPWIEQEKLKVHYYPVIIDTPNGERSLWQQRWDLRWLQEQRDAKGEKSASFDLNYMNNPKVADDGAWWSAEDFLYNPPFVVTKMVLCIDPAVTSGHKSDYTGIAVIGTNDAEDRVVVEQAQGIKLPPNKMREYVHNIINANPLIFEVIIETNNGGDYVTDRFLPLPNNVKLLDNWEGAPKPLRIKELLDYMQRGWVYFRRVMPGIQDQCMNYPVVDNDDIVDAVAKGAHRYLQDNLARARRR